VYQASASSGTQFTFPDRENGFIFLNGLWWSGPECLIHGRETRNYDDYIGVQFSAKSVNTAINPGVDVPLEVDLPVRVVVTLDGAPLTRENKGADVTVIPVGLGRTESFIVVDEPRMYHLVELQDFGSHELRLSSNSPAFALYSLTFGAHEDRP
jgi:hypothetical protein